MKSKFILIMGFGALFLIFQNCHSVSNQGSFVNVNSALPLLLDKTFELSRIEQSDGTEKLFSPGSVSISFSSPTMMNGNLHCNKFDSNITISETTLTILEQRMTLMGCGDNLEEDFTFEKEYDYEMVREVLVLRSLVDDSRLYFSESFSQ